MIVVSHDRTLLNLLHSVWELNKRGITVYGGNYDFYAAQKALESESPQEADVAEVSCRSRQFSVRFIVHPAVLCGGISFFTGQRCAPRKASQAVGRAIRI